MAAGVGALSPRSVSRYLAWRIRPESAENTEPKIHQFACTSCPTDSLEGTGVASEDFESARGWIYLHLAKFPEHTGYRESVTRHWRADLLPGPVPATMPVAPRVLP